MSSRRFSNVANSLYRAVADESSILIHMAMVAQSLGRGIQRGARDNIRVGGWRCKFLLQDFDRLLRSIMLLMERLQDLVR
jgi:hypothetical protein